MTNQPSCPIGTLSEEHFITPMLRDNTFYCSCRHVFEVSPDDGTRTVLFHREDFERISAPSIELPELPEIGELLEAAVGIPIININITLNVGEANREQ